MPETNSQYLDTQAAAQYLGLSPKTLEALRVKGGGPLFAKLSAGRRGLVRYRLVDLDTWMEGKLVKSTSAATVAAA